MTTTRLAGPTVMRAADVDRNLLRAPDSNTSRSSCWSPPRPR